MLVAIIDGAGFETTVGLYWEQSDGSLREARWPHGWSLSISEAELLARGVKVVRV
jgi:hypothetical protein